MTRQLFFLLILLLIGGVEIVQSQPLLNGNLYNRNKFSINPAYAGSQERMYAAFQGNRQSSSVSNSPQYFMFNVHGLVKDNLGIGMNIYQGNSGFYETTVVDFSVAYTANLSENQSLSFGLNTGYAREQLDRFSGNFNDYVDGSDPTLSGEFYDQGQLKIGTGLVYRMNNLEVSAAFPKLMRTEGGLNFNFVSYAGFALSNNDGSWVFTPSIMYQVPDGNENLLDVNFMGEWDNLLWGQVGYRSNGAINFGLGATLESIGIGYSYGYVGGDMSEIVSSIHEVLVSFTLAKKPPEEE